MQLMKWFSRIINRISLVGKWVHIYRIKKAKQVLAKIKEIYSDKNNGGKAILYLRKINPYVFEELVLTAIENSNIRVIRNKSYSNDGGIDGIFKFKKGKVVVQSKRYKGYINNKHVEELSSIVKQEGYLFGVFAHTGRTGEKAKNTVKLEKNMIFISGDLLLKILVGDINIEHYLNKKMN
jgi:restriction system protein